MKRTTIEISRHHVRNSSLSSLGSSWSCDTADLGTADWLAAPAPATDIVCLASSSPEIQALCKKANFAPPSHPGSSSISIASSISNASPKSPSSIGIMTQTLVSVDAFDTSSLQRPVAVRVSLSPDFKPVRYSPQRDVTDDDLTFHLQGLHIEQPIMDHHDEEDKENRPPTTLPRRPPRSTKCLRRFSLHRRISFDSLPSTREIGSAGIPIDTKSRPRHRRNTRHILLPRSVSSMGR